MGIYSPPLDQFPSSNRNIFRRGPLRIHPHNFPQPSCTNILFNLLAAPPFHWNQVKYLPKRGRSINSIYKINLENVEHSTLPQMLKASSPPTISKEENQNWNPLTDITQHLKVRISLKTCHSTHFLIKGTLEINLYDNTYK